MSVSAREAPMALKNTGKMTHKAFHPLRLRVLPDNPLPNLLLKFVTPNLHPL